jgi:hypothetical protein
MLFLSNLFSCFKIGNTILQFPNYDIFHMNYILFNVKNDFSEVLLEYKY